MEVGIQFTWIFVFFILFKYRGPFKYYFKFTLYYLSAIILAFLCIPYFLLRPKDVRNFLFYADVIKHLTKLLGIKWTLKGSENLTPNTSFIIVSNHQSSFDIMGMFNVWSTIHLMTVIAKKELLFVPGFGFAAYLAGLVFIDRNGAKGKETMNKAMQELKRKNIKLWVFPEGTRRNTGKIHEFKKGAFHTAIQEELPIVPVVFSSYQNFMNKDKKIFDDGEIIIKALPEVSTKGLTFSDIDDLMLRVRNDMSKVYDEITKEANKEIRG